VGTVFTVGRGTGDAAIASMIDQVTDFESVNSKLVDSPRNDQFVFVYHPHRKMIREVFGGLV